MMSFVISIGWSGRRLSQKVHLAACPFSQARRSMVRFLDAQSTRSHMNVHSGKMRVRSGHSDTEEQSRHVLVEDGFEADLVNELRLYFDQRFSNPLQTTTDRFVWDYWHVPGQYCLMRTPSEAFFPAELYSKLEDAILQFGESRLGIRGISPIWLSYYTPGCYQEFHTDSPHGPWAFVLSLTKDCGNFTGGETKILRKDVLEFWRHFDGSSAIELPSIEMHIDPLFARLTVFDPRFPHGVRTVESGKRDPRDARIVLHGWFTEPTAYFEGSIDDEKATDILNESLEELYQDLGVLAPANGLITLRIHVSQVGNVDDIQILSNTLIIRPQALEDEQEALSCILACIEDHVSGLNFSSCIRGSADAQITLPFIFD